MRPDVTMGVFGLFLAVTLPVLNTNLAAETHQPTVRAMVFSVY